MNRISTIQSIIKKKKAKLYLEIGVKKGNCFLKIITPKKIGVDPKFQISKHEKWTAFWNNPLNYFNTYYEITSDAFFSKYQKFLSKKKLDVVFIDGLHTYEQTLKDVFNSLKNIKDDGVIVMHDCNPRSEVEAYPAKSIEHVKLLNLKDCNGFWCGDVWKTIAHLRSTQRDLNIFVLNCDFGLGIITKGKPENLLNYSLNEIKDFTYKDLEKNRNNILNLKPTIYLYDFMNKKFHSKKLNITYHFFITANSFLLNCYKFLKLFLKPRKKLNIFKIIKK